MKTYSTLGEIVQKYGGLVQTGPFGSQLHESDYQENGVPVVMPTDINDGRIDVSAIARISEVKASQLSRHKLKVNMIVYPRRGEITKCAFVELSQDGFICGTGCIKIELPIDVIYPEFFYYYLNSQEVTGWLKNNAVGSTMLNLSASIFKRIKVPDIDFITQKNISAILSNYDNLIDTNRRRIKLLEESARLLFREWFVYFRFPGHEKVKIADGVPEGWERIHFMSIISAIESGGRPKGGAIDMGIPSIGAENVNGIGNHNYSNEKYVPEEYYQRMMKGKVISKDVLLYKDGANIGRTTLVGYGYPHDKCCVNEHVFILRTKNNIQNWLYFFLSQNFIQQSVANLNSNSAQPGISQDKLSNLKIIFPNDEIVKLFDDITEGIVKQIFILSIQNQKLAEARDLLLPRLMSGAIEI
ncbi:MAG: restriction endonuclease subunit S [bacterium]